MSFSVALCTYNGAAYIVEQLQSIVSGSVPPEEIVVCDDRSADDTVGIVSEFARSSAVPIRLEVNDVNLGYVKNFEKAVLLCRAPIVFLSDQDDVWNHDKAETILGRFADPDVGGVFSDAALVNADLSPMGKTMFSELLSAKQRKQLLTNDPDEVFRFLLARPVVTGATMAFRRSLVEALLPVPESRFFIHDGWLALAIAAVSSLVVIERPLIAYRQHPTQQIGMPKAAQGKDEIPEEEHRARYPTLRRDYARLYDELRMSLLSRCEIRPGARRLIDDAIAHNRVRLSLANRTGSRPFAILKEIVSGRYARYSSGALSAASDLVRPQRP